MPEEFTEAEVLRFLRDEIRDAGSQSAFARKHAIRPQEVTDALTGRRPPAASILAALGVMPVCRYIPLTLGKRVLDR